MNESQQISTVPYLIWVSTVSPSRSLDSATWLETTEALRELGWRVSLIAKGDAGLQTVRGVEVRCVPHPPIYFWGQWVYHLGVLRFLAREWRRADMVLFHQISALWLLPLVVARKFMRRKRPLLVMDTRDLPDYSSGGMKLFLRRQYYNLVYWLVERLADGQTAITSRMAQLVNIPSAQLWGLWPSGVDIQQFAPAHDARSWPKGDEPIRLMYIGRLLRERNLLPLCQAVTQANRQGMSFSLHLYGDGGDWDRIEAFTQDSGMEIQLSPPVPHDAIPKLLAQAHVGVTSLPHPSEIKYQASSPVKLFEYMAAGLPILSTSSVCHTEVVENGNYAFWADSTDAGELLEVLRRLWQRRADLGQLGVEAAEAAQYWTWRAAAGKLSSALHAGLNGQNSPNGQRQGSTTL